MLLYDDNSIEVFLHLLLVGLDPFILILGW